MHLVVPETIWNCIELDENNVHLKHAFVWYLKRFRTSEKYENKVYVSFLEANYYSRMYISCYSIPMFKTQLHDVFHIYLIVYHGAEFMFLCNLLSHTLICYASLRKHGDCSFSHVVRSVRPPDRRRSKS